jgi:hypothetical protein
MSASSRQAVAFYREVAQTKTVWGIKDLDGFPAPVGRDGKRAMPFWSSQSRALNLISTAEQYAGFVPVAIDWEIFCNRWVPGLERDGLLVGVNWAGSCATGYDISR